MPKFPPPKSFLRQVAMVTFLLLTALRADAGERPRVGLALGGGGARGAAHIGILRVLEQNNIPVDYIAGTSMGAVVGSLYASGFTADEIEQILAEIDWTDALRDGPPRIKNPIRRKTEDIELNVRYRLGLSGGGVVTPPGLLNGQNLDLLFREIMQPVSHIHDFDELPIPFRAVATDLGVGETVVIGAGDLVRAVRASMSVPGAFTPVDWQERVLVDGGVVDNVPAGIVRQMGADIVIAVDVGSGLADVATLKSALAVSLQSTQILLVNHTQDLMKLLEEEDIFIRADPEGIGGADFPRALEAVPVGEEACAPVMATLKKLAVSPANYQSWRRAHAKPALQQPPITAIEVDDRQAPGSAALVRARISQPVGQPLDLPALKDDIDRIFGIGRFSLIDYQLFPHEGGRKLVLQPVEHSWGSTAMRFGMGFSDDFDGSRNYQVLLETLTFSREKRGREWRLRLGLGESSGLSAEVMQPLDLRNRTFTRLEGTLRQTEIGLIEDDQRLGKYATTELFGKASLGRNFGSNWELTANLYHGRTWLDARAGFAYLVPDIDRGLGRSGVQLVHDTFNDFAFPTSGRRFMARIEWPATFLGAEINNRRTEWHLDQAFSFGQHSFLLGVYGAEVDRPTQGVDDLTLLGGMFHLSGYRQDEIYGDEYLLSRLIYYKYGGGGRRSMVGAPFVMGVSLEYGDAWSEGDPWRLDDMLFSGSVFAGIDTFLGSVYMGLGLAEEGRHAVYFAFGPLFHLGRETAHGTI